MFRIIALCSIIAVPPALAADAPPPKKRNVVITPESVAASKRNVVITRQTQPISAVIGLESATYQEVEPFLRQMLSAKGTLGYVAARKSVVVHDQKTVVEKIRAFIRQADAPGTNIRIQVEFLNSRMNTDRGITADFHRRRPGGALAEVQGGKIKGPRGVKIGVRDKRTNVDHNVAQQIMTVSGHPARIFLGRRIPDPSWLAQFEYYNLVSTGDGGNIRQEHAPTDVQWTDVGSALYVLPVLRADGVIEVELVPAVTFVDGEGLEKAVRVQKVGTRVIAYSGARIFVGGGDNATRKYMSELFGPDFFGKRASADSLQIWVTPTVVERKQRPTYTEHPERRLPPARFFK